jgi:hypothetical protein
MQLARVQSRAEDVARTREAIEAETLADTEAVLHRLRAVESSKQAILQHDAEGLASDIATIDRFYAALTSYQPQNNGSLQPSLSSGAGATVSAPGGGGPSPPSTTSPLYDTHLALDFMRAYPELCAEADRLTAKAVRQDIDVRSDDFERETASRIDLASKYQALVDLVAAKDRIILQMLREREAVLRERENARDSVLRASSERDEAVDKISKERDAMLRLKDTDVAEWTKIVDVLTGQLVEDTEKLAKAQGISSSSSSSSSSAAASASSQQQQNMQMYGNISPSTSLRSGTGGGSGHASVSAVYGSGGGSRYNANVGIHSTPPHPPQSLSSSQHNAMMRGLSQQQQQQQQLMNPNLPPPPMGQGGGSAFIAKRYQDIVRSTSGVGAALPIALHSRNSPGHSNFSSLAVPVPAVRADEAIAFNEYLARSKAGHVPFPQPQAPLSSSSSSSFLNSNSSSNPLLPNNNLGAVVPDQGLLQPSPVPEVGSTPGRLASVTPPVAAAINPTSISSLPAATSSSTGIVTAATAVPPSPKWQGEAQSNVVAPATDPSLSSIPMVAPPSAAGGDATAAQSSSSESATNNAPSGSGGGDVSPEMQ